MGRGFFTALLVVCFGMITKAQINLVQNPSFEDISSCPTNYNQIKLAVGWDTLRNGGGGSTDLFNACANPNTNFGVPVNTYGLNYQIPKTGLSYSMMGWYLRPVLFYQREYIQNVLVKPLEIGKTYCVSFYVSLTNRSQYAIDELGVYFDNGSISTPPLGIFITNPQVKSTTGVFYSDTLNWMKVQGVFTANSNFTHMTLGNFRSNIGTNKLQLNSNGTEIAEYYMDDVSVIEINTKAYAGRDTLICKTDSVFIGRPNEVGLECEWFANNTFVGSGSGMWVKPQISTEYIVKQDICGFITYDTVKVHIKDEDCQTTHLMIPNVFTPNEDGLNDAWYFEAKNATNVHYTIYNRWGNLIKDSDLRAHTIVQWDGRTTAGESCPAGIYYFVLSYTDAKGEAQKKNGYITLFR